MQKLNINGIEVSCDNVNCSDEEMMLKLLVSINNDKYYDIKKLMRYIKTSCNIDSILSIVSGDTNDIDNTIETIDKLVNDLTNHKAKLESTRGTKTPLFVNDTLDPDIDLEFEAMDCEDKVIVLKIPSIDIIKQSAIRKVMEHVKKRCNAKEIIAMPDIIKIEAMGEDVAVETINTYIDKLYEIRDKIS
jgi:hypothetical protein